MYCVHCFSHKNSLKYEAEYTLHHEDFRYRALICAQCMQHLYNRDDVAQLDYKEIVKCEGCSANDATYRVHMAGRPVSMPVCANCYAIVYYNAACGNIFVCGLQILSATR